MAVYKNCLSAVYKDSLAVYKDSLAVHKDGLAVHKDGLAVYTNGLAVYTNGLAVYKNGRAVHKDGLRIKRVSIKAMTAIHLGFDMGIRNLAYCLIRHEEDKSWNVVAWDNVDLLEGGVSAQSAKKCVGCGAAASWISHNGAKWCKACATRVRVKKSARGKPEHPTIPCALSVAALRSLASTEGVDGAKKMKKDALLAWAGARYLMPWKPAKAMDSSLGTVLAAMDKWLDSMLPAFAAATLIRLENQPVMKGPTMKSVQMILYTLLSHRLAREHRWNGRIEFVHAGTKTRGAKATAAASAAAPTVGTIDLSGAALVAEDGKAYRERKSAAEAETVRHLTERGAAASTWLTYFQGKSKKSDLADAFLMALRI